MNTCTWAAASVQAAPGVNRSIKSSEPVYGREGEVLSGGSGANHTSGRALRSGVGKGFAVAVDVGAGVGVDVGAGVGVGVGVGERVGLGSRVGFGVGVDATLGAGESVGATTTAVDAEGRQATRATMLKHSTTANTDSSFLSMFLSDPGWASCTTLEPASQ